MSAWAEVDSWKAKQSQLPLDARTVLLEEAMEQYRRENAKSRAKRHFVKEWHGSTPNFVCTFCRAVLMRFQDRMSKKAALAIAKHAHECPEVERLARRAAEVPGIKRSAERQVAIDRLLSTPPKEATP